MARSYTKGMTIKEKLDHYSIPEPNSGCWLWIGSASLKGYGILHTKNGNKGAHRLSWIENYGDIPVGMFVCHKCDTPACINPEHLFLGTVQDNVDDAKNKGRFERSGEKNYNAILTSAQVVKIFSDKRPPRIIAEEYGVGYTAIHDIKHGYSWKHLNLANRPEARMKS